MFMQESGGLTIFKEVAKLPDQVPEESVIGHPGEFVSHLFGSSLLLTSLWWAGMMQVELGPDVHQIASAKLVSLCSAVGTGGCPVSVDSVGC